MIGPRASAASNVGIGCFYYQTYCGTCATSNLWTCTSNKCSYTHTCANSGNVLNGCPSETRTGQPLTTNCEGASGTCKAAVLAGVCTADADCDGKTASDNAAGQPEEKKEEGVIDAEYVDVADKK